ncbi:MAG: hypothetical protein ABIO24_10080, partial [Saprospiraceae bacterium]
MWKKAAVFIFLFQALVSYSQSDSLVAEELIEKACTALERKQPAESRRLYDQALQILQSKDLFITWLECHVNMARCCASGLEQPFLAQEYLDDALHGY